MQELHDSKCALHAFRPNSVLFAFDAFHLAQGINAALSVTDAAAAMAQVGPRKGRRKRLRTVAKRLDEHHQRFPAYVPAFTAHVGVLREMRRLEDADRLSAKWRARFPDDIKLALARAGVHEDQGQMDEALAEVTALRARGR